MNTILEAIKMYPIEFAYTCERRAITTPSEYNRTNHRALAKAIYYKQWRVVENIITQPQYHSALNGVITCLNMMDYSDNFTVIVHSRICELFGSGKIA